MWYAEDENLNDVASSIIHDALELPNVVIVRCERKSGWESGTGLVKIEVSQDSEVKEILKSKRKLKKNSNKHFQNIFLRLSKKEEILAVHRNEDVILREMGVRNKYIRLASGHLVKKRDNSSQDGARGKTRRTRR